MAVRIELKRVSKDFKRQSAAAHIIVITGEAKKDKPKAQVVGYQISKAKLARITKRAEQIRKSLAAAQPRERPLSAARFRSVIYR